jgi:hypothetical protein
MSWENDRTLWRGSFVTALNLLARATARLPVGALDPTLSGASAVELYTGGLWSTPDVELLCGEPRPLMTELVATGFRWIQRPRRVRRVLWHPRLQVGVDIAERSAPVRVAQQANSVVVEIDLGSNGQAASEDLSVKVVGVEDLIVWQVGGWLRDGAASGEAAAKLRALVGLALDGVGGALRVGYLQRRLALETDGEVVFESPSEEAGEEPAPQLRRMSLTQMQSLIGAWRDQCGLSAVPRPLRGACRENVATAGVVRDTNDKPVTGGASDTRMDNVIALDEGLPIRRDRT